MYASSGGHETVCREDEERKLCKYLISNALQRPHDWTATTARLGRNDRTIELQCPHNVLAVTARFLLVVRSLPDRCQKPPGFKKNPSTF